MSNVIKMVKNYQLEYFKKDLTAALGVAAISLPQVMAFALIAGVNPVYGIFTFIVSNFIFAFIGRSNYMIVGPTNMVCVTIASSLNAMGIINSGNYLQFVFLLTCLVGVFQMLMGFFKIAKLVNYISNTVIMAITAGVSFIIISGQLEDILALDLPDEPGNVITDIYNVLNNLQDINYYSLGMGLFTIIIVLLLKKFTPGLPAYLMAVIISIIIVPTFGLEQKIEIVGSLESSLPKFNVPPFELEAVRNLLSSGLSIAILGITQVLSIVKVMEEKTGEITDLNKEFIGQGFINIICSFFSSFAITGSFSRSFTNMEIGNKTRLSALFSSLSVFVFILLFANYVSLIPISSLAGIVILVAILMFDYEEICKCFTTTRSDTLIFLVTFITTILTPRLDYAIYFGVVISGIIVLKNTSELNYSHLRYYKKDELPFSEKKIKEVKEDEYIVINLAGSLHFNASENLKEHLDESFQKNKVYIIRMRRIEDIDLTTVKEIENFIDRVQASNGEVIFSGLNKKLYKIFKQTGLLDKIGSENCFSAKEDIFRSTEKAIERAEDTGNHQHKI